jgi:hypothetical protein
MSNISALRRVPGCNVTNQQRWACGIENRGDVGDPPRNTFGIASTPGGRADS